MELHQTHIHPVIRQRNDVLLLRHENILNKKTSKTTGLSVWIPWALIA